MRCFPAATRLASLGLVLAAGAAGACARTIPTLDWTCDFDASESRPLAGMDPDGGPDEAGHLPAAACQATCGPPATSCTYTTIDGGPGAVCPVCSF
jgi:hypothetical protein